MDGKAIDVMSRMSQNMPVKRVQRYRQTTPAGELYMAIGSGPGDNGKRCWHAMYVLDQIKEFEELAKCGIEFSGNLSLSDAKQALFDMAYADAQVMRHG